VKTRSSSLVAAVLAGALSLFSCNQHKTQGSGATAEPKSATPSGTVQEAAKEAPPSTMAKTAPAAPAPEAALRHLPEDCPLMKMSVDLQRFGQYRGTGAEIADLARKALAKTDADEKYVAPVIETLRRQGVNLTQDLQSIAACATSPSDWVALLAVNLKNVKVAPDKLLTEAAEAAGKKDVELLHDSGVGYVALDTPRSALGFVAPGVLGFASSPSLLAKAASTDTPAASGSKTLLAWVRFPVEKERAEFKLSGDEKTLTASLHLPLDEQQRAELKKDAVHYLAQLRSLAEKRLGGDAMHRVSLPRLQQFFKDFSRLDMSVTKDELDAKLSVPVDKLNDAVAALAAIKPADIERVVAAAANG
jgi:hypothetical protein